MPGGETRRSTKAKMYRVEAPTLTLKVTKEVLRVRHVG